MTEIGLIERFTYKNEWTVHCEKCEHNEEISVRDTPESTLVEIAECTYLHYWREELQFLEELAILVDTHSTSSHPFKREILVQLDQMCALEPQSREDQPFEDDLVEVLSKYGRPGNAYFSLK